MKRKFLYLIAALIVVFAVGWTIFAHASELPPIPLTTASSAPARIAGDANGDSSVDVRDITAMVRALAGGWNVTVDESAADVSGDGAFTLLDVTVLRRYLAGGWNIVLK